MFLLSCFYFTYVRDHFIHNSVKLDSNYSKHLRLVFLHKLRYDYIEDILQ